MSRVRFAMVLHNHQPVGNFDHVIESAYRDSYEPLLGKMEEYPEISFCLHTSGPLLDWLIEHRPEYIERLRPLVQKGQVEILGGGYYEPILTMIPPRDRRGQILGFSQQLAHVFDTTIRGMWIPERVWEQSLVTDIVASGIEYTILDDEHFRAAGRRQDELASYFTTEDQGSVLRIFPGSESMRYLIPFREPHEFLAELGQFQERHPNGIVVFADDGEKFGTWPDTKAHVYEHGWIDRFLSGLRDNAHWIETTTLARAARELSSAGQLYLPDGSYREMTEWALPTERLREYRSIQQQLNHQSNGGPIRSFIKGGSWRNFKVKYPETRDMYARMMEVSGRLERLVGADPDAFGDERIDAARRDLYRGQCNCAYWHGAFGGLYLPHLRGAIFQHLISADGHLDRFERQEEPYAVAEQADFNFDGKPEFKLANDQLAVYLSPAAGGTIYELDVRNAEINLASAIARRPEAYHDQIRQAHRSGSADHAQSIHDRVVFKQEGLDQQLQYDAGPRHSLVDRIIPGSITFEEWKRGSFPNKADGPTECQGSTLREPNRVGVCLRKTGRIAGKPIQVEKTIKLRPGGETLDLHFHATNLPTDGSHRFAVEFNLAALATGADDRYASDLGGQRLVKLGEDLVLTQSNGIRLTDEWIGIDIDLRTDRPADLWMTPTRSVSQSEGGFELVHQSIALLFHWLVPAGSTGWESSIQWTMSTRRQRSRLVDRVGTSATV